MTVTLEDGRVFTLDQGPPIDVTCMGSRPDPAWRFTDAAGHKHRWIFDANRRASLPSLVGVQTTEYDYEDGEPYLVIAYYECPLCLERVEPGWKPSDGTREYRPGVIHGYYINGVEVSEEYWRTELQKAVQP